MQNSSSDRLDCPVLKFSALCGLPPDPFDLARQIFAFGVAGWFGLQDPVECSKLVQFGVTPPTGVSAIIIPDIVCRRNRNTKCVWFVDWTSVAT